MTEESKENITLKSLSEEELNDQPDKTEQSVNVFSKNVFARYKSGFQLNLILREILFIHFRAFTIYILVPFWVLLYYIL